MALCVGHGDSGCSSLRAGDKGCFASRDRLEVLSRFGHWPPAGVRTKPSSIYLKMRRQNRSRLFYPAATTAGGRIGQRRLVVPRRRPARSLFGGWRRRPEALARAWSRTPQSPPSALNSAQIQLPDWVPAEEEPADNRYYQETIDLKEDSILSDDLLEVLSRPLAGGPVRPRHAFATGRITSRPAHSRRATNGRARRIEVL